MRFRRAVCIFNPAAGRGIGRSKLGKVQAALSATVGEVRLAPTQCRGHATQLARDAASAGCDLIVVYSGDGTVNEVLQRLTGKASPAMFVLPGGTANVLVHELGMPISPVAAARMLPELAARAVRLGEVRLDKDGASRYFLLMCGAGLDAAVADRTSTRLKKTLGQGAFGVSAAMFTLQNFPRARISAPGRPNRNPPCALIVVSKSRMYGGKLVLTPGANLLANHLEAAQYPGTSRLHFSGYLTAAALHLTDRCPGVRFVHREELRLEPVDGNEVQVQVDGEIVGELPAAVLLSDAICTLLLPPNYGLGVGLESNMSAT